jgi:hypothetical protein
MNKQLGYYLCDGFEFFSKIQACIHAQQHKKPVDWIFNDLEFSMFNWQVEPIESLDYLYDQRTKQLREKYDYIILSYSGGSDSNNILESFIRQNLHIDEIVVNHVSQGTAGVTVLDVNRKDPYNFSAEYQLHTVPRLQYIQNKLPKTKITTIDVSNSILDSVRSFKDESWVLDRRDNISLGTAFRYNYFYFDEVKKRIDKGKQVAIIIGTDKPITRLDDQNNFYITFTDATVNVIAVSDHNQYPNVTVELFYWSKDSLPILSKQAHTIKHWLTVNPSRQLLWRSTDYGVFRKYQEKWIRDIIYTNWDKNWFQADKAIGWWHNEFDNWLTHPELKAELDNWQRGKDFLINAAQDFLVKDKLGRYDRFSIFQKKYFIGKL